MQVIYALDIDPEEYVAGELQKQISPPIQCPNCKQAKGLWALGYYGRNVSRVSIGALVIIVRRFRCRRCRKTTSVLPAFAQPYRFVQNRTIERSFSGEAFPDEVIRHSDLLSRYWRRFEYFLPEIERSLGKALERAPPSQPRAAWRFLLDLYDDLAALTKTLVTAHQITPFGRYRCHCPNGKRKRAD
jgi:hypothetical protein